MTLWRDGQLRDTMLSAAHLVCDAPLPHALGLLMRGDDPAQPFDIAHAHVPRDDDTERVPAGRRYAVAVAAAMAALAALSPSARRPSLLLWRRRLLLLWPAPVVSRQRLAVHLIREQHVAPRRESRRDRYGRARAVIALKLHMRRASAPISRARRTRPTRLGEPALAEHIAQRHAAPPRRGDRAAAPRVPRRLADGVELAPPVPAALDRYVHLDLHPHGTRS